LYSSVDNKPLEYPMIHMTQNRFVDWNMRRRRRNSSLLQGAAVLLASTLTMPAFADGGGMPCAVPRGSLSNIEPLRAELGGWYIQGAFSPAPNVTGTYGGGGGGVRVNCALLLGRWVVIDQDYRIAVSAYGDKESTPDFGIELGVGFARARWSGRLPGSFVFGVGGGASLGRPIWLGISASVYPMAFGRLLLKPSTNTRIQIGYRMSPISTQYKFYAAWVQAHDLDIAAGYKYWHLGVRARMEDVILHRDPSQTYTSYWIGPFVAFVYN
jgi:hypothetical protein